MIWFNSLPQFIIMVLDMPLTRTYVGHLLIMALQGAVYWEAIPNEVKCLSFNTFKKNIGVSY